jgi:hypothetical protein
MMQPEEDLNSILLTSIFTFEGKAPMTRDVMRAMNISSPAL